MSFQSSQETQKNKMTKDEINRKVADMVRYILFADRKKVGIKRPDLVKHVMKEHSRSYAKIFEEASKQINEIFGFDIVPMQSDDGKQKGYTLVNNLHNHSTFICQHTGVTNEKSNMGLLMIMLSMIFMNEYTLNDVSLWHTLRKFGIHKDKSHRYFGDVDKLIQDFVKKSYLEKTKIQGPEGPTYQYHFGARTKKEVTIRQILEFVTEIYGADSIESWKIQYREVLESERDADVVMND